MGVKFTMWPSQWDGTRKGWRGEDTWNGWVDEEHHVWKARTRKDSARGISHSRFILRLFLFLQALSSSTQHSEPKINKMLFSKSIGIFHGGFSGTLGNPQIELTRIWKSVLFDGVWIVQQPTVKKSFLILCGASDKSRRKKKKKAKKPIFRDSTHISLKEEFLKKHQVQNFTTEKLEKPVRAESRAHSAYSKHAHIAVKLLHRHLLSEPHLREGGTKGAELANSG